MDGTPGTSSTQTSSSSSQITSSARRRVGGEHDELALVPALHGEHIRSVFGHRDVGEVGQGAAVPHDLLADPSSSRTHSETSALAVPAAG